MLPADRKAASARQTLYPILIYVVRNRHRATFIALVRHSLPRGRQTLTPLLACVLADRSLSEGTACAEYGCRITLQPVVSRWRDVHSAAVRFLFRHAANAAFNN